nr:hypothetical protein [Euzebyales bacterium]
MGAATAILLAAALLGAACTDALPSSDAVTSRKAAAAASEAVEAEARTQPADRVDLTLYFRRGQGRAAHLQ